MIKPKEKLDDQNTSKPKSHVPTFESKIIRVMNHYRLEGQHDYFARFMGLDKGVMGGRERVGRKVANEDAREHARDKSYK